MRGSENLKKVQNKNSWIEKFNFTEFLWIIIPINYICPFSSAAQAKTNAKAEIHEPPKFDNVSSNPTATDQEPIRIIPKTTTYELRKCLSGDETLMLSAADNPDLFSGNETLVNVPNNEDGEASDEEIEDIEMEDDNDIGKED